MGKSKTKKRQARTQQPAKGVTPLPPAGKKEVVEYTASLYAYKEYFFLYRQYVRMGQQEGFLPSLIGGMEGKESGYWFQPLGDWIPCDAVILHFQEGKARLIEATTKLKMRLSRPSPEHRELEELSKNVSDPRDRKTLLDHLREWKEAEKALGHLPNQWNLGFATALLRGEIPREHLTVFFPQFRLDPTNPKIPLGISLKADWGGMSVKVYNPSGWQGPGLPGDGEVLSLEDILRRVKEAVEKWRKEKVATDTLAKLLLTASRMEGYARQALRASRSS